MPITAGRSPLSRPWLGMALLLTVAAASAAAPPPTPYDEVPLFLSAEEVLPPELRQGERYRVWDRVENDGYLNRYVVDSDFGVFEATSTSDLRKLVGEIGALEQLEEVSRAEAFADAVENTVKAPVQTARAVVDEPVETLKRVPGGVGRYFKRTARRARDLVEEVQEEYGEYKAEKEAEKAAERESTEDVAQPADVAASSTEAPEEAAQDEGDGEDGEDDESLTDEARQEATRYATRKLGYRRERRRIARELGVDPYTANEVLNEELDRVAKAAALGGLAVKFSSFGLPVFVYDLREVSSLVWNLRPLDLRLRNEKLLKQELGLEREQIDALYDNPHVSATLVTTLVEAIVALDRVGERQLFTEMVTAADSRDLAAFVVRIAAYHARRHLAGERVDRFERTPLVPVAMMVDGSRVVALAVDYLAWTEEVDGLFAERGAAAAADIWPSPVRRVVLEGAASEATRSTFEARGWELTEWGFAPQPN